MYIYIYKDWNHILVKNGTKLVHNRANLTCPAKKRLGNMYSNETSKNKLSTIRVKVPFLVKFGHVHTWWPTPLSKWVISQL